MGVDPIRKDFDDWACPPAFSIALFIALLGSVAVMLFLILKVALKQLSSAGD